MERDLREEWLEILYDVLKLAKNVDSSLSCILLWTRKGKKAAFSFTYAFMNNSEKCRENMDTGSG